MITKDQVGHLEKLIGQLHGAYAELSALARKSSTDAVNNFKLRFVNVTLKECNEFLPEKPLEGFEQFEMDDVPSNSDVTFIIAQYIEAIERFRAANVKRTPAGDWVYDVPEKEGHIRTAPPAKLTKR